MPWFQAAGEALAKIVLPGQCIAGWSEVFEDFVRGALLLIIEQAEPLTYPRDKLGVVRRLSRVPGRRPPQ
jgi:hypothetical protein